MVWKNGWALVPFWTDFTKKWLGTNPLCPPIYDAPELNICLIECKCNADYRIQTVWYRKSYKQISYPGIGTGPWKVLKRLDFQAWEGPKVIKLHNPGKFRYPDAEWLIPQKSQGLQKNWDSTLTMFLITFSNSAKITYPLWLSCYNCTFCLTSFLITNDYLYQSILTNFDKIS